MIDCFEDILVCDGWGMLVVDMGMIWFGFCFSDDVCEYGYLVFVNMFVVVIFGYL